MRTTLDIPDSLYRQVRAKSALDGTTLRAVTITLYTDWLAVNNPQNNLPDDFSSVDEVPSWGGLCSAAVTKNAEGPHDMESIRRSIAEARRTSCSVVREELSPFA